MSSVAAEAKGCPLLPGVLDAQNKKPAETQQRDPEAEVEGLEKGKSPGGGGACGL